MLSTTALTGAWEKLKEKKSPNYCPFFKNDKVNIKNTVFH
jgi:hypothetical protein